MVSKESDEVGSKMDGKRRVKIVSNDILPVGKISGYTKPDPQFDQLLTGHPP